MIEFGSDFHFVDQRVKAINTISELFPKAICYADGRQALIALYRSQGWKRIWVPEYFCHEVIGTLIAAGLNIAFYSDYPEADDKAAIMSIPFKDGDVLLRVNFFGLRNRRSNAGIPVPVVEDHTHDLISDWALQSDADWAVASLRKSIPIAEGGILWSPAGQNLPEMPDISEANVQNAEQRWQAMYLKRDYLSGAPIDKDRFREKFIASESYFDTIDIAAVDKFSACYLHNFNLRDWYMRKRCNWGQMEQLKSRKYRVLVPEKLDSSTPFSYTILCESGAYREQLRHRLIEHKIYPAILWAVPETASLAVKDFSSRMLSIHCDGRYTPEDIIQMKSVLELIL